MGDGSGWISIVLDAGDSNWLEDDSTEGDRVQGFLLSVGVTVVVTEDVVAIELCRTMLW